MLSVCLIVLNRFQRDNCVQSVERIYWGGGSREDWKRMWKVVFSIFINYFPSASSLLDQVCIIHLTVVLVSVSIWKVERVVIY